MCGQFASQLQLVFATPVNLAGMSDNHQDVTLRGPVFDRMSCVFYTLKKQWLQRHSNSESLSKGQLD